MALSGSQLCNRVQARLVRPIQEVMKVAEANRMGIWRQIDPMAIREQVLLKL